MKLFTKKLFLFILFAIPIYCLVIFISGRFIPPILIPNIRYIKDAYGHSFSRFNDVKQLNDSLDILFLGSSHAYRGFDPRNFMPLKTFNLGSNSQTPMQTNLILNRYLDKVNPKVIIYEVFPNTFASDGVESSLNVIANDVNDMGSIEMALKINNIKVYNTLVYGIIVDFFGIYNSFSEPIRKSQYGDTYIPGGFVQKDIQHFEYMCCEEKKEWKIKDLQIKAFEKSISKIKQKKIDLILVYAPVTSTFYNSYTNNLYFDSLMKSYNFPYYNFNEILDLNDSLHFYDRHHLNQDGVELFNKKLWEFIRNYME